MSLQGCYMVHSHKTEVPGDPIVMAMSNIWKITTPFPSCTVGLSGRVFHFGLTEFFNTDSLCKDEDRSFD